MKVSLRLLGTPAVLTTDGHVPLSAERRFQLLAYLAVQGTWITRERLAHIFWPDRDEEHARGNLRYTLTQVRKLPWLAGLEVRANALRWTVDTDLAEFKRALSFDPAAAIDLYAGPLLAGFDAGASEPFLAWLNAERRRLHGRWRDAAIAQMGPDSPAAGSAATEKPRIDGRAVHRLALAERLLHDDPLDEPALQIYVRLLQAAGRESEAQRAYRGFVERLSVELGIEPSAQTRALLRASDRPSALDARAGLSGGPLGDDGFIGRVAERRELAAVFAREEARLVVLLGPGGIGKSALAQRVRADVAARFADGACFVPLEDLAEPDGIGPRIARELGLALQGAAAPIDQVAEHLLSRSVLVVLDNFEHLASGAALLNDLLQRCPAIKLLVTSRSRLGLAEEQTVTLEGLACPSPEDDHRATDFDAVRLFIDRACQTRPAFDADTQMSDIAEICRQFDGMPLAIELAAPWTRLLTCQAIAEEIRAGTELLQAEDPSRPARQASIETTLAYSWRLLMPAERDALAKLSVFRGGFTREAAREVAGALLPVLASLVDKSLVQAQRDRFDLHPLVGRFAADYCSETQLVEASHRSYYASRLAVVAAFSHNTHQSASLAEIERELSNAKAAWRSALVARDVDALVALCAPIVRYYTNRGFAQEAVDLHLSTIDELSGECGETRRALTELRMGLANVLGHQGDWRAALGQAQQALTVSESTGDDRGALRCMNLIGLGLMKTGDPVQARTVFLQALDAYRTVGDREGVVKICSNLAGVESTLGHVEMARQLVEEALLCLGPDNARGRANLLSVLGTHLFELRDLAGAIARFKEGLALCEANGFRSIRCFFLINLGVAYTDLGELDIACEYLNRGREEARIHGVVAMQTAAAIETARLHLRWGDSPAARNALRADLEEATNDVALQLGLVTAWGSLLAAEGRASEAADAWNVVVGHPASARSDRRRAAESLAGLCGHGDPHVDFQCAEAAIRLDLAVERATQDLLRTVALTPRPDGARGASRYPRHGGDAPECVRTT